MSQEEGDGVTSTASKNVQGDHYVPGAPKHVEDMVKSKPHIVSPQLSHPEIVDESSNNHSSQTGRHADLLSQITETFPKAMMLEPERAGKSRTVYPSEDEVVGSTPMCTNGSLDETAESNALQQNVQDSSRNVNFKSSSIRTESSVSQSMKANKQSDATDSIGDEIPGNGSELTDKSVFATTEDADQSDIYYNDEDDSLAFSHGGDKFAAPQEDRINNQSDKRFLHNIDVLFKDRKVELKWTVSSHLKKITKKDIYIDVESDDHHSAWKKIQENVRPIDQKCVLPISIEEASDLDFMVNLLEMKDDKPCLIDSCRVSNHTIKKWFSDANPQDIINYKKEVKRDITKAIKKFPNANGLVVSFANKICPLTNDSIPDTHKSSNAIRNTFSNFGYVVCTYNECTRAKVLAVYSVLSSKEYPQSFKLIFTHFYAHGRLDFVGLLDGVLSKDKIMQSFKNASVSKVIFFDCCRHGTVSGRPKKHTSVENLFVIHSTTPGNKAYFDKRNRMGIATQIFLKLLKEKKTHNFGDLQTELTLAVKNEYTSLGFHKDENFLWTEGSGNLDTIRNLYEEKLVGMRPFGYLLEKDPKDDKYILSFEEPPHANHYKLNLKTYYISTLSYNNTSDWERVKETKETKLELSYEEVYGVKYKIGATYDEGEVLLTDVIGTENPVFYRFDGAIDPVEVILCKGKNHQMFWLECPNLFLYKDSHKCCAKIWRRTKFSDDEWVIIKELTCSPFNLMSWSLQDCESDDNYEFAVSYQVGSETGIRVKATEYYTTATPSSVLERTFITESDNKVLINWTTSQFSEKLSKGCIMYINIWTRPNVIFQGSRWENWLLFKERVPVTNHKIAVSSEEAERKEFKVELHRVLSNKTLIESQIATSATADTNMDVSQAKWISTSTVDSSENFICEQELARIGEGIEKDKLDVESMQTTDTENMQEVVKSYQEIKRRQDNIDRSANLYYDKQLNEANFPWLIKGEIRIIEELFDGDIEKVKKANYKGTLIAAKIQLNIFQTPQYDKFIHDMNEAFNLRHPNLVLILGASMSVHKNVIFMELLHMSMHKYLVTTAPAVPSHQFRVCTFLDVARALNYLHLLQPHPIIHQNISSANVFVEPSFEQRWKAKVCLPTQIMTTETPGTLIYSAPEASKPSCRSSKLDVYSFGILLIAMSTTQYSDRVASIHTIDENYWKNLIRKCMKKDPEQRPIMSQILEDLSQEEHS